MKFTRAVLQAPDAPNATKAIIFGQWTQTELGPEDARAFLRHAYGEFYPHDFSNVDLKDHTFVWQYTYRNALLAFFTTQHFATHTASRYCMLLVFTLPCQRPPR